MGETQLAVGRTICFASAKGGSGKTIVAATLANILAAVGKKVLLIDLDYTTCGLTLLLLPSILAERRQSDAKKSSGAPPSEPKSLPFGGPQKPVKLNERLWIVPTSFQLAPVLVNELNDYVLALDSLVKDRGPEFDVIIFDSPAGTGTLAKHAMAIATQTVIVSEFDPVSVEGVERMRLLLGGVLDASTTWILLNKVLPEFAKSLREFTVILRYLPPIPWDVEVTRAYVRRELPFHRGYANPFSFAIVRVAYELFPQFRNEIEIWRKSIDDEFRQPMRAKAAELTRLQEANEKILLELDNERERLARSASTLLSTYAAIAVIGISILIGTLALVGSLAERVDLVAAGLAVAAGGFGVALGLGRFGQSERSDRLVAVNSQIRRVRSQLAILEDELRRYNTAINSDLDDLGGFSSKSDLVDS